MSTTLPQLVQELYDINRQTSCTPQRYITFIETKLQPYISEPQLKQGPFAHLFSGLSVFFKAIIPVLYPKYQNKLRLFIQLLYKLFHFNDDLPPDLKHQLCVQLCFLLDQQETLQPSLYLMSVQLLLFLYKKSEVFPYYKEVLSFFSKLEVCISPFFSFHFVL